MRLAFFSPLNPIQSGISDYSEELLLTLDGARVGGSTIDLDLFIDKGYKPSNKDITRRFGVRQGRAFGRVAGEYDSVVYQMGNSAAHAYIYDALLKHPGVVVMHEFVLHHLRVWMTLNGGRRKEYLAIMERQYGAEGLDAARRVLLGQYPEALFNYPLSDEVIQAARGIIVHSRYMEGLVKGVRPDVPVSVVPMGVPLPPYIARDEARARLGLDPDLFLVTSVGHLNPYKRVSATLRAFKALLMEVPNSAYLLIGSRSPNYDPTRQIEMLGLTERVRSTGYVSPQDFPYYLAASDVCLNLRYPTAGETSASLLRIMGAGVPVLVSRTGSFEELPDEAAGKVDVGEFEEELLLEYLLLLARRPDLREAMSVSARRYVAEHHTLEQAATGYLRFLSSLSRKVAGEPEITLSPTAAAVHVPAPTGTITSLQIGQAASAPPSPSTPARKLPDNVTVAVVAEAAAELGIEESDTWLLAEITRAIEGLAPGERK
ncbi:MAG: glycosyltransferase family 4 protein [Chloroflexota bacterium]|nr:glycosyltransferase family 4 protein [Chloroflexota bacterium]MDQ5866492.1 glycosyltransferase family 4 protein [Chloroflexota bacterium]